MIKQLLQRWNQYKYRFVPWLATNISERDPRVVSDKLEDKILGDGYIEKFLLQLFTAFHAANTYGCTMKTRSEENNAVLQQLCGFSLERRQSLLKNGGRGVFVASGTIATGSMVSIYPGLVYQPWEPVFFVSLANSFLFRCADSVHIDGKDTGLSRMMFNSCAKRDRVSCQFMCDTSWMTETPVNPLAVGQYVNNQSKEFPANVAYQEFDVPMSFPQHLRQYIPNTEARLHQDMEQSMYNRLLRMVVLVSLREISAGEELFSTYYTIIHKPADPS